MKRRTAKKPNKNIMTTYPSWLLKEQPKNRRECTNKYKRFIIKHSPYNLAYLKGKTIEQLKWLQKTIFNLKVNSICGITELHEQIDSEVTYNEKTN